LGDALAADNADIAMAAAPETNAQDEVQVRTQPVFCLLRRELLESLVRVTHGGGRKIDAWTAQHHTVVVPFDDPTDDRLAFCNVNTLQELQALENAAP
jgi:molybdopterin-guanine dinucleotide biosynthesis protein A